MWWTWGRSSNDYYSIIARAVSKLPTNTVEARQELYDHARAALARQLKQDRSRIRRERRRLEKAIRQVETSENVETYKPASTGLLIASAFFLSKLWVLDCTCMASYWVVARLPTRTHNDLALLAFRKAHEGE